MNISYGFPARMIPLALIALLAAISPVSASPDAFWPLTAERTSRQLTDSALQSSKTSGQLLGVVNVETGAPIRAVAGEALARVSGTPSLSSVLQYIDEQTDRFGVRSDQLEVLHSGMVLGKYYMTARQTVDGHPVLGTTVLLRVRPDGRVSMYGADVVKGVEARNWGGSLDPDQAAAALASFAEIDLESVLFSQQIWVRLDGNLYPAWELTLAGQTPLERPHGLVSAESGEILGYYNNVQHEDVSGVVTGPIYPIRIQDPVERVPFSFQEITIGGQLQITDEDGQFFVPGFTGGAEVTVDMALRGPWVTVINDDQPNADYDTSVVAAWEGVFGWRSQEHGRFDEFNMFYHTNFINQYYDVLDPDFDGMDYSVNATVGQGDHYDNAFWNGQGMFFGTGSQFNNLALFSDVIYHEYTHGVTGFMYPPGVLPYIDQPGAMNEAWSDYFPCSIHNSSAVAPGIYAGTPNAPLRDLNNTRRYPENWVGEVHGDGLIIGGAMWDLRNLIGDAQYSDSLIHYAKYGFANTFEGYMLELLEADDDNGTIEDGTPNAAAIYQAFGDHGIGPGHEPNLVVSSIDMAETEEDGILSAGEMATIQLTLWNDVYLFPPAATNVTVTATSGEDILWTVSEVVLEEVGPGEEVELPVSFSLQVSEQTATRYEWIHFSITANDGAYSTSDSIRVTLGSPQILLVDDGGATSYMGRFAKALDSIGSAAREWSTTTEQPTTELLGDYPYLIWFTGDQPNPISQTEETQLVEYVEAGGHLILSGQHVGVQLSSRPALRQMIGVENYLAGLDEYGGHGVEGEPASEGLMFVVVGGSGANNQSAIGGVTITEGTRPLYLYFRTEAIAAIYQDHESGGKAAYFTFGLEAVTAVSTTQTAGQLLSPVLTEMGYLVSAPEGGEVAGTPGNFTLAAPWPNPFNPATRVAFTLPTNSRVTLAVYNLLGREVLRAVDGVRTAGRHEVTLDLGEFGSGAYFIRLQSDQGVLTQRAVLVK